MALTPPVGTPAPDEPVGAGVGVVVPVAGEAVPVAGEAVPVAGEAVPVAGGVAAVAGVTVVAADEPVRGSTRWCRSPWLSRRNWRRWSPGTPER